MLNHRDIYYRMRSREKGFTLTEIIVAAAILLLLLSLVFAFIVPTMRASVLSATRAEIQQEVLRAQNKISFDLGFTVSAGVSLSVPAVMPEKGPVYLGVMHLDDIDAGGNKIWEQALFVYSWEGRGQPLIRKVWTPSSPVNHGITLNNSLPQRFPETTLAAIAADTTLTGQVLARDVELFSISSDAPDLTVASPLEVTIEVVRSEATGRRDPERFTLTRKTNLRNRL